MRWHDPALNAGRDGGGMRPDTVQFRAQFSDYPARDNDDGRARRWINQGGKVLRFSLLVLGLVIGLQATCSATDSPGSDPAVEADKSQLVVPAKDDAASNPAEADLTGKEPVAAANEVPGERVRDHGARDLTEMGLWFLKAAGILAAMVFVYKLLVYWVRSRRRNS
ncbi:MAG TPA: hypothetical protein VFS91_01845 [Nitrobacter sp.]|nr:hypothetical protein [Nitrobacter sp.]